ncbi:MAG: fatty acid desaturase [Methylococcales bacterium]
MIITQQQKQQTKLPVRSFRLIASISVSLILPGLAFLFLLSGPHNMSDSLCWIMPFWLILFVDLIKVKGQSNIHQHISDLPFTLLVYFLAILQLINLYLMLVLASQLQWHNPSMIVTSLINLLAIKVIIGTTSSFSGIVVAHELIHRRGWFSKLFGRLLLSLVCYEHFYSEHLSGHHCNVGRQTDPATARFGESYNAYWRRTVPGQFNHAWQIENKRLQLTGFSFPELLRHHVFQGLVFQGLLMVSILMIFGISAFIAFLIQALAAIRKLEAVNYIEHWGLERTNDSKEDILSWETDSWLTLHALIGLSKHTDHHRHANKPFQQLDYTASSPQLPYGYFASIFLSIFANAKFQQLVSLELKANNLGPFQKP